MSREPISAPPKPLTWNAGGWFGAQIGGTCWIAICAAFLSMHNLTIATAVFALFLAANVIGIVIWRARNRISAYSGIKVLLIVIGVASIAAVFVVDRSGLWHLVEGVGGKVSARQMYLLIPVMIVGLFVLFWSLNRSQSGGGSER